MSFSPKNQKMLLSQIEQDLSQPTRNMRLVEQNTEKKSKTPWQWFKELKIFLDEGGQLSSNDKDPSARFYNKYQHYLNDGYTYTPDQQTVIKKYLQLFETGWKRKNRKPHEWLTDLQDFLAQGGQLSSSSSGLGYTFYTRYYHYKTVSYDYTADEEAVIKQYIELFEKNWDRK